MSSATLTDTERGAGRAGARARASGPAAAATPDASSLRPWHFFLLATLSLATGAVVFMRHATGPAIVFVAITVCTAGYAGYALYRTLAPLAGEGVSDEAVMIGGRTRAALERDKGLTLRAIKELEFDRAMGKVADGDFAEIRDRLRARALRLMRQLDGAEAYRSAIERDLAARVPAKASTQGGEQVVQAPAHGYFCTQCGASADAEARFCRMCGTPLHTPAGARP
jgi:zinc-ribbon domain